MNGRRRVAAVVALVLAGLATPATASAPREPLPKCVQVPGRNDRCEQWASHFTQATSGVIGMALSPKGDRVYVAGNGVRSDNKVATIVAGAFTKAGAPSWVVRAPSSLPTTANAIALSPDGRRLYVGGYLSLRPNLSANVFHYYYLLCIDTATGRLVWVGQYQGVGSNINDVLAIAVAPNNAAVYVTGSSEHICASCQNVPSDWVTIGYSARNGKPLWLNRWSGAAGGLNAGLAVKVSPNGRQVFVTGYSERPTQQPTRMLDFATSALRASDGTTQWTKRYAPGLVNVPTDLFVSPRGDTVYVAGNGDTGTTTSLGTVYTVVAYAARNGAQRWVATYRDVAGAPMTVRAAALSKRGDRIYVTGTGQQPGPVAVPSAASAVSEAFTTVAFATSNGKRAWAASFAPDRVPGKGTTIAVNPAGNRVYVGGLLGTSDTGYEATVAYDAAGAQQWVARYDLRDPVDVGTELPAGVAVAPDGKTVFEATAFAPVVAAAGQARADALLLAFAA